MKAIDNIKISIISPVYNVEKELERTIKSVLIQKPSNIELILVDDGSTDNSGNICDEYEKKYPEIIKTLHKKNGGQLSARCLGIEKATGDVVIFLDADDILLPNSIETIREYFLDDPELEILIYSWQKNVNGKITNGLKDFPNKTVFSDNKNDLYELMLKTSKLSVLWRKAIKIKLLKDDDTNFEAYYSVKLGEDLAQSLYPMTVAKKIMFVDDICYEYIYRSTSITKTEVNLSELTLNSKLFNGLLLKYSKKWNLGAKGEEAINLRVLNKLITLVMFNLSFKNFDCKYFKKIENKIAEEFENNKQYNKYIYHNNYGFKRKIYLILMKKGQIKIIWLLQKIYGLINREKTYQA